MFPLIRTCCNICISALSVNYKASRSHDFFDFFFFGGGGDFFFNWRGGGIVAEGWGRAIIET